MTDLSADLRVRHPGFTLEVSHVFPGQGITALFGPSSCGKSTLLRVVAGFERGATGRVAFGEEIWLDGRRFLPPHRRGVGYVFQDARLFPHLSVRGNLDYAHGRAAARAARYSYGDVLDALDLGPLLARRVTDLSGGETQRVAIGRTLLARPRLLLMDEPLAALDTRRKGAIMPYIRRLPEVFGVPVIYVTHALEEVTQLCDRIVALSEGRIVAAGGVAETLERLDLAEVQGRFEAGAILTGRIVAQDRALHLSRVDLGGVQVEVPQIALAKGAQVRLRVRARDVALALERPRGLSMRNCLEARLMSITPEPATAFAEVLLDVAGQHLRARITRAAVADLGLAGGQAVLALIKAVSFDRQALPRDRSADAGPP
ncbi:MAG: molybdenum ABC transporter ATP-binding protein [Roseovarius sp.]|nr:molybdenum ABC transporter ATP-binding protein [Roseovarius sp.]